MVIILDNKQSIGSNRTKHNLQMKNRQECQITGIVDVKSYEPQEVVAILEDSILTVKGEKLHVSRLSVEQGELNLEGKINSLCYANHTSAAQKGENLLARMFR